MADGFATPTKPTALPSWAASGGGGGGGGGGSPPGGGSPWRGSPAKTALTAAAK
jgi:hypothetical protein